MEAAGGERGQCNVRSWRVDVGGEVKLARAT